VQNFAAAVLDEFPRGGIDAATSGAVVEYVEAQVARTIVAAGRFAPAEPQQRAAVEPARLLEGALDHRALAWDVLFGQPQIVAAGRVPAGDDPAVDRW
jgi:hypothetical protein